MPDDDHRKEKSFGDLVVHLGVSLSAKFTNSLSATPHDRQLARAVGRLLATLGGALGREMPILAGDQTKRLARLAKTRSRARAVRGTSYDATLSELKELKVLFESHEESYPGLSDLLNLILLTAGSWWADAPQLLDATNAELKRLNESQ